MTSHNSTVGALPPPLGEQPDFDSPSSFGPVVRAVNGILIALVSITTLLRIFTRLGIIKKRTWSDYVMVLAYCSFLICFVFVEKMIQYGGGIHQWDVPITKLSSFTYWSWVLEVFHCLCVASVRATVCLQFLLIFVVGRNRLFWIVWTFLGINIAYYFQYIFVSIFQCIPVAKNWDDEIEGHCMGTRYQNFIVATGAFNLLGDLCMLAFPLYCIWNMHLPRSKRFAVAGLFAVGIFAPVASTLRLVFSISNNANPDQTYTLTQVGECVIGELCAGILVGNLVVMPRFVHWANAKLQLWYSTYLGRRSGASRLNSGYDEPEIKLARHDDGGLVVE